jgi:hypothetical protein
MRPSLACLLAALVGAFALAACDGAAPAADGVAGGLFDADPFLADAGSGRWVWMPDPSMRCRDSSATGFGVLRRPGSDKLLIMLQAGGACFNAETCATNRASFDATAFASFAADNGTEGIYSPQPANPFRDWNVVFVPHCTGDVYTGNATDVAVEGVPGLQQFVGERNMRTMLGRIEPYARRASVVLLTGAGFAATANYGLVAGTLDPVPVHMIADAGPIPPDDSVLTPELQARMQDLWNGSVLYPPGCEECQPPDGMENVLPYYAATYPDRAFGLISYTRDMTNRTFFGYDNPNCVFTGGVCRVPGADFQAALFHIRATLDPYPNAGTYYITGYGHTSLDKSDLYFGTTVEGVPLPQWMADALDGTVEDLPPGRTSGTRRHAAHR